MNLPNALTLLRLVLVPFLVYLLHDGAYAMALALFAFAGLTDAVDGYVAKHFHQETELGKFLDPVADKALVVALYISLTWLGWIPFWLMVAVVARDGIIVVGALGFQYLTGALEMAPTVLSKANTAFQLGYVALVLLDAAAAMDLAGWRKLLAGVVLVTTVASGLQYVLVWLRKALAHEQDPR
jgi:cardiolipin synthase